MQTKTDMGQNDGRQENAKSPAKLIRTINERLQRAGKFELNFNVRLHLQEKITGILQAPLDIGHLEFRGFPSNGHRDFSVDRNHKIVIAAM